MKFNFLCSLCKLDIILILDAGLVKIFVQSVGCPFSLLTESFALKIFFSFTVCQFSIVDIGILAIDVLFRKFCPVPTCSRLLHTFSSVRVSGSMLKFLNPLRLDRFAI